MSGQPGLKPVYFTKRLVGLFDLAHVRSLIVFFCSIFLLAVTISNRIKLCPSTRSHSLHTWDGNCGWLVFFWGSQWTMCFTSSEQIPFQLKNLSTASSFQTRLYLWAPNRSSLTSCWFTLNFGIIDADSWEQVPKTCLGLCLKPHMHYFSPAQVLPFCYGKPSAYWWHSDNDTPGSS